MIRELEERLVKVERREEREAGSENEGGKIIFGTRGTGCSIAWQYSPIGIVMRILAIVFLLACPSTVLAQIEDCNPENPNGKTRIGMSCFLTGIMLGDSAYVATMMQNYPPINLHFGTDYGRTPLSTALNLGKTDLARELIAAGADRTGIHANGRSICSEAIMFDNSLDLLEELIPYCDLTSQDDRGNTALIHAARNNKVDVINLLINSMKPLNLEAVNLNGETIFSIAESPHHAEVLDVLQ